MNYVLEDNFNFFEELKSNSDINDEYNNTNDNNTTDNTIDKCMISHMPLTYNYITLPCKHKFNYISLYNELIISSLLVEQSNWCISFWYFSISSNEEFMFRVMFFVRFSMLLCYYNQ